MDSDHTDTEWPSALAKHRGCRRLSPVPDVRMRCDPPENLSETDKANWRGIVEKVRPGWFYSSEALLRAYVGTWPS
jgi:hypothetical protein